MWRAINAALLAAVVQVDSPSQLLVYFNPERYVERQYMESARVPADYVFLLNEAVEFRFRLKNDAASSVSIRNFTDPAAALSARLVRIDDRTERKYP